jgi:hypothetical protein
MKKPKISKVLASLVVTMMFALTSQVKAGPVILGGDDLTDHGSRLAGANIDGWLYIENAINDLLNQVTRPGPYTVDIVALGSSGGQAGCPGGDCSGLPLDIPHPPGTNTQNAGSAIGSVAVALGKTINFFNGTDRLNQFFDELAAGTINPAIIWIAGTGADNDLNATDAAVLNANALAINAFVLSGGGLMAHGSGPIAYGWLSTLLPGLIENSDGGVVGAACDSTTLTLTLAGTAAFPTLTSSDIQAGPCHSNFTGDLGGLDVLAVDGRNRNIIIGGPIGTEIVPGAILADIHPQSCPNPVIVLSKGVLPVAILGTADFDVTQVNPTSVQLEGIAPLRWSVDDVATPFIGALNDAFDCNILGPDGFADLTLKFDNQEILAAVGPVNDGEDLLLTLTGTLFDGSPIKAMDVVVIQNK